MLANLVRNAWRYTPANGKITIRAALTGEKIIIEVTDTGIGISPEDQKRLFSQFFRSDEVAVREHPGWGLALHLSNRLIQALGGEMGAESTLGRGSRFWFFLPVQAIET